MEYKIRLKFIGKALFFGFITLISWIKCEESFKTQPLLMPNVQPKVPETYLCTAFAMPQHDFQYIVEFTPNASMHTAHHILIYGCEFPGQWNHNIPRFVWDCSMMEGQQSDYFQAPICSAGSHIIYAWAKDAPPLRLPQNVAFRVGKDTGINYLVLQVHYVDVDRFLNGETDNSGIILSLLPSTTKKITKTAGVLRLETEGMIRPKEVEHFEVAYPIKEPVILYPFAFRTHTHALGKVVSGYKIDKKGMWHLIGKHNPQEPQMFYSVEDKDLSVEYGDILAVRCTMYNYREKITYVGLTSEDEMCAFYVMYYVEGDKLLTENNYYSSGPSTYYWYKDPLVSYVPQEIDKEASQLDGNVLNISL